MTPPVATLLRRWALAGLAGLAALAAGCASLPSPPPRAAATTAAAVTASPASEIDESPLARVAAASLDPETPWASGARLLIDGDEALAARLALIGRATQRVDAQYYLVAADRSGHAFLQALHDAAARGVQVRLLVDDLHVAEVEPLLVALAAQPNVEVRLFNPLPARSGSPATRLLWSLHEFERVNRRMHNKLLLVDDAFAITGGRNIGDAYFEVDDASHFVDMDVLVAGPVVGALSASFAGFWRSDSAWPVAALASPVPAAGARRAQATLPAPAADPPIVQELVRGRVELLPTRARVVADRPDRARDGEPEGIDRGALYEALATITQAQHEVVVATPYLIPGAKGLAIARSLVQRGVQLSVLTNSAAGTDEPLAHWRYAQYRRDLLDLGVALHELRPDLAARTRSAAGASATSTSRLHAKLAIVDRQRVLIGSMNMDPRSARLNTEIGLLLDSPALAAELLAWSEREALPGALRVRLHEAKGTPLWIAVDDLRLTVYDREPELPLTERLRLRLVSWFIDEALL